ncbi:MAG TPA: acylphosphatase [Nitrolancea sp.]
MADGSRVSCVVTGRVQGVGFRAFVIAQAKMLGLTGWVRNGADGRSVELTVEGATSQVEQLLREIEQGPPLAKVDHVRTTRLGGPAQFTRFEIQR